MAEIQNGTHLNGENNKSYENQEHSDHQQNSGSTGILKTEILNVQNKRYYFDVKEHDFGRFLKLAETAQSGRKSRLVIPMYLVPAVEKVLLDFEEELNSMPEFNKDGKRLEQKKQEAKENTMPNNQMHENGGGDGAHKILPNNSSDEGKKNNSNNNRQDNRQDNRRDNRRGKRGGKSKNERRHEIETEAAVDIKSSLVEAGRRRYYFNLKENNRGRYLRVKAIGDIPSSMAGRRRGGFNGRNNGGFRGGYNGRNGGQGRNNSGGDAPRAIVLPASGLGEFRAIVSQLLKEYQVDEEIDQVAQADKNIEQNGTANDKLPASQRFSSKSFRKIIFLDAGENSRGFFARMTELQSQYRESVTVPSRHFKEIGEWFLEAARVTADDERENNRPDKAHHEDGSGDARPINGNHAEYDDEEESSDLDVVAGNRRRQEASDSEE